VDSRGGIAGSDGKSVLDFVENASQSHLSSTSGSKEPASPARVNPPPRLFFFCPANTLSDPLPCLYNRQKHSVYVRDIDPLTITTAIMNLGFFSQFFFGLHLWNAEIPGDRLNPSHGNDPSCSSDNARSLTY